MAYHSNENDHADNERRIEERRRTAPTGSNPFREAENLDHHWKQFTTSLDQICRLEEMKTVRHWEERARVYRFRRGGVSLVFRATSEGMSVDGMPGIVDHHAALDLIRRHFPIQAHKGT